MKTSAKHHRDEADRVFRKAWKLLGRLERQLVLARAEEEKRARQLGDGTGRKTARRAAQLEAAQSEIAQIEGLLTELSELITSNARAQSGSTLQEVAREVAASIREDAASAQVASTIAADQAAAGGTAPTGRPSAARRRKPVTPPPGES